MCVNHKDILKCVSEFRKNFKLGEHEIISDIFSIVDDSFIILRFPNKMGISGMYMKKKDREKEHKCIYINNYETRGRQNFSFAHELYHVFFKESNNLLSLVNERDKDPIEKEAEIFASNLLIPRYYLLADLKDRNMNENKSISKTIIFDLQRKYNASFQAIIYAIDDMRKHDEYDRFKHFIPIIGSDLKKYYKSFWDKLEEETLQYNSNLLLNSPSSSFEFPEKFKQNLIQNYKKGLVDIEEIIDIFSFFEKEQELDKIITC